MCEWKSMFNHVINTNPDYSLSTDDFINDCIDNDFFSALDVLKCMNVCCCPEVINAFNILKPDYGFKSVYKLNEVYVGENDEDYDSDSSDDLNDKLPKVDYTNNDSTQTFRYFIKRVKKIPSKHLKNHDRVDITKFLI